MTATPFISVIVPHLNQPNELYRCLAALARQRYPWNRYEVIVVDNGSSHRPAEITAAFEHARLIDEPTPGPGPARSRGVAESCGRILAFIDADCIAHSKWLASIAAALSGRRGPRIIGGDVRIAFRDARRPTALEAYESVFAYQQKDYIERKRFSGTGNLAMHRPAFEKVGPFAGIEVAEDREWGRRATACGLTISYVPEMVVFHPARTSLRALREKWSRQQSHDFEEWRRAGRSRLAWVVRAVAVAGSPVRDIPRAFRSLRISGPVTRCLAALVLVYVRWVRAFQMLRLLIRSADGRSALFWNRPGGTGPSHSGADQQRMTQIR